MATAAPTAATRAVSTGAAPVRTPTATPARATCPMPSPIRDRRRWTRKTPTSGAAMPTSRAATSAWRMKSRASSSAMVASGPGVERAGGGRARQRRLRDVELLGVVVAVEGQAPAGADGGERVGRPVEGDAAAGDEDDAGHDVGEGLELVRDDDHGRAAVGQPGE